MDNERRPSRATAPDYLEELDRADTARIRMLRDECRAQERRLSYIRRLVQGHLDLALAELSRRDDDEHEALVARVTDALTGPAGTARSTRAVGLYDPSTHADDLDAPGTAELPDLDVAALTAHIERLRGRERALSDQRAVLLGHLDRLQATLVERYRDGRAGIDEVVLALERR